MGHGIQTNDSLAWWGRMPWHKLGREIERPMMAAEMIKVAGLEWGVEKWPLTALEPLSPERAREIVLSGGETRLLEIPDFVSTVRVDADGSLSTLGVVGSGYVPVQNAEAFDFLDGVGDVRFEVAGSLFGGQRVWGLARFGKWAIPGTDDENIEYLLVVNDHSGKMALRAFFTSVRVVCANTLALSLHKGRGDGVTIRHCGDVAAKLRQAQRVLSTGREVFADWREQAALLAKRQLTQAALNKALLEIIPDPKPKVENGVEVAVSNTRAQNVRDELIRLFTEGKGNDLPGIRGTAWAALNAVAEFVDHGRGQTRGPDQRMDSALFGQGSDLKRIALTVLGRAA